MDKITKALKNFNTNERNKIKIILFKIKSGIFNELDIKKLKGYDNIFRVRKGKIRIIYRVDQKDNKIYILTIERRSNNTYKF